MIWNFNQLPGICSKSSSKPLASWWFQPIRKIWVKLKIFPNFRGENKKYLKPPTRLAILMPIIFRMRMNELQDFLRDHFLKPPAGNTGKKKHQKSLLKLFPEHPVLCFFGVLKTIQWQNCWPLLAMCFWTFWDVDLLKNSKTPSRLEKRLWTTKKCCPPQNCHKNTTFAKGPAVKSSCQTFKSSKSGTSKNKKTVQKKVLEIQSHQRPPKVSANLPSMGIGTPSMINVCRNFHRLFVSRNFPSFPTSMAYSWPSKETGFRPVTCGVCAIFARDG